MNYRNPLIDQEDVFKSYDGNIPSSEGMSSDQCVANNNEYPPHFHWTKEALAEYAMEVARLYKELEIWSDDLPKQMVDEFIKRKGFEEHWSGLIKEGEPNTHLIVVDRFKLDKLIGFLYNYKNPQ